VEKLRTRHVGTYNLYLKDRKLTSMSNAKPSLYHKKLKSIFKSLSLNSLRQLCFSRETLGMLYSWATAMKLYI
jgi:hypothetical protein